MEKPKLSIIIITKNEESCIRQCLESVHFADEIIVLDSGSTDNTVNICREFTEHVYVTDWPGFGIQKQRALDKATGDWVLNLDADEVITEALANEIHHAITNNKHIAYYVPSKVNYCGKYLRYGDWHNVKALRLFERENAKYDNNLVHEKIMVNGSIGTLKNHMYHNSQPILEDTIQKINHYSTLSAKMKSEQGKTATLRKAIVHGLWTFFRGYFLRLGFLDGRRGFMLAVSNAEGSYYRYVKLMLLNEGPHDSTPDKA